MRPRGGAVGRSGKQTSPSGAKDQFSRTHFTAAPYIPENQQRLSAAEESRSPHHLFLATSPPRRHRPFKQKEIIQDRLKEKPRSYVFLTRSTLHYKVIS